MDEVEDEPLVELVAVTPLPVAVPRPRIEPKKANGVGRAMLAAAMVGLQEVFEPPEKDAIAIEVHNDTDFDPDDPLAVDLDPFDPSASVAVVRPCRHGP